jgi:hypothetical protein
LENYLKIQEHNSRDDVTFTLGVHHHADLTLEEFKAKYTGAIPHDPKEISKVSVINPNAKKIMTGQIPPRVGN